MNPFSMKTNLRRSTVLLPVALTLFANAAQPPKIQWKVKSAPTKSIKPGEKFRIVLTGTPDPGWHLYALEEPQGGPIATEIALTEGDPADLLRVGESKPKILPDPNFQQPTGFFDASADFTIYLQLPRATSPGPTTLHFLVRYQSCTDKICLPPHTETIPVPLTITR